MAEANRKTRVVRETNYTLTLSADEADTLTAVLSRVGGSQDSPRKHVDAIMSALRSAGAPDYFSTTGHPATLIETRGTGNRVVFNEYGESPDKSLSAALRGVYG